MLTAHSTPQTCSAFRGALDVDAPPPSKFILRNLLRTMSGQAGLTDRVIDELVVRSEVVSRRAGARIGASSSGGHLVHLLVSGAARVDCGDTTIRIVPPGWLLDPTPAGGEAVRLVSIRAHVASLVAVLPRRTAELLLSRLSAHELLHMTTMGWQRLVDTLVQKCALRTRSLRERLVQELEILGHDFGTTHPDGILIDLPLRHGHLARLVPASRSNVCRTMRVLQDEGIATTVHGRIVLLKSPTTPRLTDR